MSVTTCAVCIQVDERSEREAFSKWLLTNKNSIHALSDNEGCGCCVDVFRILVEEGTPVPAAISVSQASGEGLESPLESVFAQAIQALTDLYR